MFTRGEAPNGILVADFDSNVVKQLVRYIYTGTIDESLQASARNLLLIADRYKVRGLVLLALCKLANTIGFETVCATLNLATLIADTEDYRLLFMSSLAQSLRPSKLANVEQHSKTISFYCCFFLSLHSYQLLFFFKSMLYVLFLSLTSSDFHF